MGKIHNNLIIENLIKTEDFIQLNKEKKEEIIINSNWFKQFDKHQKEQILKGLKDMLNQNINGTKWWK